MFYRICLAIPPGITWEELNAPPLSKNDVSYLLKYTMDLNAELRRHKRRARNTKSESIPDVHAPPNRNPPPSEGPNTENANTLSAVKPAESAILKIENVATKKKEIDSKKLVPVGRVFVNSNYDKDEVEALIDPCTKAKPEGRRLRFLILTLLAPVFSLVF